VETAETNPLSPAPSGDALALEQGTRVGRFLVLEQLGVGGMGEVYSAYDAELDRKVAIKLLRPGSKVSQSRLLKEAQAIAQVGHPNVVHVYDVGRFEGRVFIAMELVCGRDLRDRLQRETPQWRQVLRWVLDAGEGLSAAHAASVLHRDIKPSNVLVGDDGRVRVTDFGLAQRVDASRDSSGDSRDEPIPLEGTTVFSGVSAAGTPPYLAPEQHHGRPPTERSDVYQFAVTAWEALYRQRPFVGSSFDELLEAKHAGPPDPPESMVPRRVARVLRRALEPDPERRTSSLRTVLEELEPVLQGSRKGTVIVAAVAVTAAVSFAAWPDTEACAGGEARVQEVWDGGRAQTVTSALLATGVPFAETAVRETIASVDRYAEQWVVTHRDVCEATRERGEQSEAVMDLRMRCLSLRLREVDALATQLEAADATVVANAVAAAEALSDLGRCRDALALDDGELPRDAETRREVDAIEDALAEAEALRRAGRYEEAASGAESLQARAEATEHAPTIAAVRLLRGRALSGTSRTRAAAQVLRGAIAAAEVGRATRLKARAWGWLVYVEGVQLADFGRGNENAQLAAAAIEAAGAGPVLLGELATARGLLATEQGDLAAGQAHHERALQLRKSARGEDSLAVSASHNNLGLVAAKLGHSEQARDHYERALEIRRERLGDRHPDTAQTLGNLANVELVLGEPERAEQSLRTSLEIRREVLGADHPETLSARINLALMLWETGRIEEAAELARDVATASERVHGLAHPRTLRAFNNLCVILGRGGREREALDACAPIVEAFSEGDANEPELATLRNTFGGLLVFDGQYERAVALFEQALATSDPGLAVRPSLESGLGRALARLQRYEEARPLLESAVVARAQEPASGTLAVLRVHLAHALWETGGSPERARELMTLALDADDADTRQEARDWLREHS